MRNDSLDRIKATIKKHSFLIFLVLFNFALFFTNVDLQPLQPGLDPAYIYSYNNAFVKGLTFGKEIVTTYGPLGFLVHATYVGLIPYLLVATYGFLGTALGMLVYKFTNLVTNKRARILVAISLSYLLSIQVFEWKLLGIYLLLCAYLIHNQKTNIYWVFPVVLLAVTLSFIKLSLGMAALSSATPLCILYISRSKFNLRQLLPVGLILALVSLFLSLVLLGSYRPGDLLGYIANGLSISSGYSSAMSLDYAHWFRVVILFLCATMVIIVPFFLYKTKYYLQLILMAAPSIFFVWKAAIVRQDPYGHIEGYAFFIIFISSLFLTNLYISRRHRIRGYIIAILVASVMLHFGMAINGITKSRYAHIIFDPLTFWKIETCQLSPCQQLAINSISEEEKIIIGQETVDVYPWDVTYTKINDLNWLSRPSIGSFATYQPRLDELNSNFFKSDRAPKFILWHHELGVQSIDGRHLFFDEPKTLRAILDRYKSIYSREGLTILERQNQVKISRAYSGDNKIIVWNTWVQLPEGKLKVVRLQYTPNKRQQLGGILFRTRPLMLSFMKQDGTINSYRVVPNNLSQGVAIGQLPFTLTELQNILLGLELDNPVKALRIDGAPSGTMTIVGSQIK